jgi:NADH kinase
MLNSGESVIIKKSPFPIPCVVRGEGGGGWARDIKWVTPFAHFEEERCVADFLSSLLQFNTSFKNSAHLAHTMS